MATLVKSVMLKITADDGDTEAKLAKISLRADELAAKHPDLTPRVNSAAAMAKLMVLRRELKDTADQADKSKFSFAALGQAVNLFATGGLSGGIARMSMFEKVMAGLNVATGLGEPLVAGLTVAAGGLAAGFAAAGAGLGVFGLVAKSVYGQVSAAVTAFQSAQRQMARATTAAGRATALKAEAAAMAGLTVSQRGFATQLIATQGEWHKFVNAASPGVTSVMAQGIGLLPKALALMKPFLAPAEQALHGIISMVSSGLSSGGMKSFVSSLASNAGPAITKIAIAIKNVIVGIGGILKAFMPVSQGMMSGLDSITAKFATWGTTLTSHSGFQSLMSMFKSETPLAVSALRSLGGVIKSVVSGMSGMSTFSNSKMLLQGLNLILPALNALAKVPGLVSLVLYLKLASDAAGKLKTAFAGVSAGIGGIKSVTAAVSGLRTGLKDSEAAAADGASAWTSFGGKLSGLGTGIKSAVTGIKDWSIWSKVAAAATKVWTGIQIAFDAVMDANPIVLIVVAVIALIAVIVLLAVKFKPVRDFFKQAWHDIVQWTVDAWHGIVAAFDGIVHAVSAAVSAVINFVKAHWPLIVGIFLGPIGLVVALVIQHWNQIVSATRTVISDVTSFFKALPGRIISALGNVGSMLFSAGARIVQGLINGIKSMIGAVSHAIGSVVSEITSHLPFSPAKKGPLSGRGDPRLAGQRIVTYLAQGMTSQARLVTAAAGRVAQAAMVTGGGGLAGAGGGGRMQVEWIGGNAGDEMTQYIRKNIRVSFGGNAQRWATGR